MRTQGQRHGPPSWRWNAVRLLVVALLIPLTAASFAPPPSAPGDIETPARCQLLHTLSRLIQEHTGWYLVTRLEDPVRGDWTIVAWFDGPTRVGEVDPVELLVLSKPANAQALLATTRNTNMGPCDPIEMAELLDERFIQELRRGSYYRTTVIGRARDRGDVSVVTALMGDCVRKLQEPEVSLRSMQD